MQSLRVYEKKQHKSSEVQHFHGAKKNNRVIDIQVLIENHDIPDKKRMGLKQGFVLPITLLEIASDARSPLNRQKQGR